MEKEALNIRWNDRSGYRRVEEIYTEGTRLGTNRRQWVSIKDAVPVCVCECVCKCASVIKYAYVRNRYTVLHSNANMCVGTK